MKTDEQTATDVIHRVGFNGPTILQWTNLPFLVKSPKYIVFYILFAFLVMGWTNNILKRILKIPRPEGYDKIGTTYDKVGIPGGAHHNPAHKYGMPSYHAQTTAFIATFIWRITQNKYLAFFNLIIFTLTLFQRWQFKRSSPAQLMAGTIIGAGLGWMLFGVVQQEFIMGESAIKHNEEENKDEDE